jgi:hypothetical protein
MRDCEPIPGLIVIVRGVVIVEDPARVLAAARLVHQATDLFLVGPKAPDAAMIAILVPEIDVDVIARIERRDELVSMARRAGRKCPGPREIEADALQHTRQLRH